MRLHCFALFICTFQICAVAQQHCVAIGEDVLQVHGTSIVTKNNQIVEIYNSTPQFGNRELARVAVMRSVELISAWNSSLTDEGIRSVRGNSSLRVLSLINANISDAAVGDIATVHNLQELDLSGTRITDKCVDDLMKIPGLKLLTIERTSISAAGRAKLLAKNRELIISQ